MATKTGVVEESLKDFHDGTTYKLWRECACGCGEVVPNVWAQGHDARQKGQGRTPAPATKVKTKRAK